MLRRACRARSLPLKFERCDNPDCPACELRELLEKVKDLGLPPEAIMHMTFTALEETLRDEIEIQYAELDTETLH